MNWSAPGAREYPWSIPESWSWTTMGDVSQVVGGGTPPTSDPSNFDGGSIPWITPADLSGYSDKHIAGGTRSITQKGLGRSGARLMPTGTVLFSSRAPIGYVAIASQPVSSNQGFKSFVLYRGLAPDYVYHYLKRAKDLALDLASGTTFLEISGAKAAQIVIPVAPYAEQHLVVAEIEKQFSRLDAAVAALKRAQANLRRYRSSVLKMACEGRLVPQDPNDKPADSLMKHIDPHPRGHTAQPAQAANAIASCNDETGALPSGWYWSVLEDVSAAVVDCPHSTPEWTESGPICVRTTEFGPGHLDLTNARHVSDATYRERIQRLQPREGDILYSREGGILGIACVIPFGVKLCLGQRMMLIRTSASAVPAFVMYVLNSQRITGLVRRLTGGSASPHLNVKDIKRFPIPLPPPAEQHRIVAEVERRLSVMDELETAVEANLKRAERLRQAILKRAFEGRLVPQDPDDEPASVLLERIRIQRESSHGEPKLVRPDLRSASPAARPR